MALIPSFQQTQRARGYALLCVPWLLQQSYSCAHFCLARLQYEGLGIEKNVPEAIRYYKMGAQAECPLCQCNLGCYAQLHPDGEGLEGSPFDWYVLSVQHKIGYVVAQASLGCCYYKGLGVTKNLEESARWFRAAAEQGYVDAIYDMGSSYEYGEGVERNYLEAAQWYRRGAEQGHVLSMVRLACYYHDGVGVSVDFIESIHWLHRPTHGNSDAQYILGLLYESGEGVVRDINVAMLWYQRSASLNNPCGFHYLARIFHLGTQQAVKLYQRAGVLGHQGAQKEFALLMKSHPFLLTSAV